MLTADSKLLFGTAGAVTVAAIAYAIASGDRVGALALAGAALAAVLIGSFLTGRVRPAMATTAAPPPTRDSDPLAATPWPMLLGLGAVLLLVGFAIDIQTVVLGLIALAVAGAGWVVQVWREHVDRADPAALYAYERVITPAGLPVLALVTIAFVVISFSRILLAIPRDASTAVAIAAALGMFLAAMVIASRSRIPGSALAGLLTVVALGVIVGGIVAAASGERALDETPAVTTVTEVAKGSAFTEKSFTVQTEAVTIHFRNEDKDVIHNIAVYTDKSAKQAVYFGRDLPTVGQTTYVFRTKPGTYFFRCEFHPQQMTGTLTVEEPHHEHKA